jgi:hypothetical protein
MAKRLVSCKKEKEDRERLGMRAGRCGEHVDGIRRSLSERRELRVNSYCGYQVEGSEPDGLSISFIY